MTPIERLRHEFEAEEGTFLLQLRCDMHWDRDAFRRLVDAMQGYLESQRDDEHLPRWIAEGFWFLGHFVKEWSSHPRFSRPLAQGYYEAGYRRLHDLGWWLFMGASPYESGTLEAFDA